MKLYIYFYIVLFGAVSNLYIQFGLTGSLMLLILVTSLVLYACYNKITLPVEFFVWVILAYPFTALALLHNELRYLFSMVVIIFGFVVAFGFPFSKLDGFVEFATFVTIFLELLSIIGVLLAYFGVEPLFVWEYFGRDDGVLMFYYTTFSNSVLSGGVIRAASFFDEPGAFSYVIIAVALLRVIRSLNSSHTLMLLLLGLVTQSMAVLLVLVSTLLYVRSKIYIVSFLAVLFLIALVPDSKNRDIVSRVSVNDEGVIGFLGRANKIGAAADSLLASPTALLVGIGPNCVYNRGECLPPYSQSSDNPLSPLVSFGFASLFFYYLVGRISFYFLRNQGVLFALTVLVVLLQRPYFNSLGYAFLVPFLYVVIRNRVRYGL